jgi:hypothetical protein
MRREKATRNAARGHVHRACPAGGGRQGAGDAGGGVDDYTTGTLTTTSGFFFFGGGIMPKSSVTWFATISVADAPGGELGDRLGPLVPQDTQVYHSKRYAHRAIRAKSNFGVIAMGPYRWLVALIVGGWLTSLVRRAPRGACALGAAVPGRDVRGLECDCVRGSAGRRHRTLARGGDSLEPPPKHAHELGPAGAAQ